MPYNCLSCAATVNRNVKRVRCFSCNGEAHTSCVGISPEVLKSGEHGGMRWICKKCDGATGSLFGGSEVQRKLDKIMSELGTIVKQQATFTESLNFYGEKIHEFESKLKLVENLERKFEKYDSEILSLKSENTKMMMEVNRLHQQLKEKDLEMVGIPERRDESVNEVLQNVCKGLDIPYVEGLVDGCYRVHSLPKHDAKPRPIVVRFKNKTSRNDFLRSYKRSGKNLKLREIGFDGNEQQFYVNESLTKYYQRIFYLARKFSKDHNYKYCWVQEGRVLLRQNDSSRILHIEMEGDLPSSTI